MDITMVMTAVFRLVDDFLAGQRLRGEILNHLV